MIEGLIEALPGKVDEAMDHLRFADALAEIWRLVSALNKYIDVNMPWTLAKDETKEEPPRHGDELSGGGAQKCGHLYYTVYAQYQCGD